MVVRMKGNQDGVVAERHLCHHLLNKQPSGIPQTPSIVHVPFCEFRVGIGVADELHFD